MRMPRNAWIAVASIKSLSNIVQQQVELDGEEVAGHGHTQAEEQTEDQVCDREGLTEQDSVVEVVRKE